MLEQLNEQLTTVKNQQHKRKTWENQLEDYHTELQERQHTAADLKITLVQNKKDLEKLEGLSFAHLLASLSGSTHEQVMEKRNELESTQSAYDEVQHALTHMEDSINSLQEKIAALPNTDQEYQRILKEKEQLMQDAPFLLKRQYNELTRDITNLQSAQTETSETIKAGRRVEGSLTEAIEKLNKARRWGIFDRFGGSLHTTSVKHNHIDEAKTSIRDAQKRMRVFHKVLLDNHKVVDLNLEITSSLKFADFFLSGMFMDSIIQSKIEDSLEKTMTQQNEINKIVSHLTFRYDRREKKLIELKNKKKSVLESYGT